MQVHKDTIDKIPNALPNRNSVDIEIYGMNGQSRTLITMYIFIAIKQLSIVSPTFTRDTGIPEADLREHEKNRGTEYVLPPAAPTKPIGGPSPAAMLGAGLLVPPTAPAGQMAAIPTPPISFSMRLPPPPFPPGGHNPFMRPGMPPTMPPGMPPMGLPPVPPGLVPPG